MAASTPDQSHLRALHALVQASGSLLSTPKLEEVLPKIMTLAHEVMGADCYAVWRRSDDGEQWDILHSVGLSDEYKRNSGITGQRAQTILKQPFVVEDAAKVEMVSDRQGLYKNEGIASLIAYPMQAQNVEGTVTVYFRNPQKFDQERIIIGSALANMAAAAISTAELYEKELRGRERAEQQQVRSEFLSRATAALGSSLDHSKTLKQVSEMAIPTIADWCSVFVLRPDGQMERASVAHKDKEKVRLAEQMQEKYPPDLRKGSGLQIVMSTAEPQFIPVVTDDMLSKGARDAVHLEFMRQLEMHSVMLVPMKYGKRVLGVLTLVNAESGRTFTKDDLELAESLADRAAIAIENARLFEEVRREVALREQAQTWMKLAQEAARVTSWELDLDSEQFKLPPEAYQLLGIEVAAPLSYGEFVNRMFVQEDRSQALEALRRARRKKGAYQINFRIAKGDEVRWISARGKMFYNSGESIMVGVMIDVTDTMQSGK